MGRLQARLSLVVSYEEAINCTRYNMTIWYSPQNCVTVFRNPSSSSAKAWAAMLWGTPP